MRSAALAAAACLAACASAPAPAPEGAPAPPTGDVGPPEVLAEAFEGTRAGCFVLRGPDGAVLLRRDAARCAERFSPCSTFKVPNSLIGLDSGVVSGADQVFAWDGVERERDVLNRDHDLRSAIRHSVVWYYQELARRVGFDRMQAYVSAIPYGNADLSGGLTQFWLGSTLAISADEQVAFLARLARGDVPFGERSVAVVHEITVQARGGDVAVHGKTGSHRYADRDLGWYVGWVERPDGPYAFACNVEGTGTFGTTAQRVAEALLVEAGVLEPELASALP